LVTASAIQGRPSYDEDLTPAEQQGHGGRCKKLGIQDHAVSEKG
jgi:hypothetical protein